MQPKRTIQAVIFTILAATQPVFAQDAATADTVVATVNGAEITLGHMIVLKQRLPERYQTLPPEVLYEGILDQLVQQTLLGQAGGELSAGSIKSLENEERALRAAETIRVIAGDATTDEAIQAAYEAAVGDFASETEYNASHIIFLADENATEEQSAEARAKAAQVIADLEGGADFATLAQERSEGPSAPNGGNLGWFQVGDNAPPERRMVEPFEDAVAAMKPGEISTEPVQTRFGWHVIRLNETRLIEAPTLDELRGQIVEQIQQQAIETRVTELTEGAEITPSGTDVIDPALLDDLSLLGE